MTFRKSKKATKTPRDDLVVEDLTNRQSNDYPHSKHILIGSKRDQPNVTPVQKIEEAKERSASASHHMTSNVTYIGPSNESLSEEDPESESDFGSDIQTFTQQSMDQPDAFESAEMDYVEEIDFPKDSKKQAYRGTSFGFT